MSKMVKRIVLLLLVVVPMLACEGTPTPEHVGHPTATSPCIVETVELEAGEAVRVICPGGSVRISDFGDQAVIYCLESY